MDNRGSKFLCVHRIKEQRVDGIGHIFMFKVYSSSLERGLYPKIKRIIGFYID